MISQKQATEPQRLSELVKLNSDIFFYLSFLFFDHLDLSKDVSMISFVTKYNRTIKYVTCFVLVTISHRKIIKRI